MSQQIPSPEREQRQQEWGFPRRMHPLTAVFLARRVAPADGMRWLVQESGFFLAGEFVDTSDPFDLPWDAVAWILRQPGRTNPAWREQWAQAVEKCSCKTLKESENSACVR